MNKFKLPKITEILINELDFDFRAESYYINSMQDFEKYLLSNFGGDKKIFYRGERIKSFDRTLLPSIYRNKSKIIGENEFSKLIDADALIEYYKAYPRYYDMVRDFYGDRVQGDMYTFLAFTQHYLGVSPLIDFTKSLYVALSFALKNRQEYKSDIVIYTIEILEEEDYTSSLEVANSWLKDYSVFLFNDPSLGDVKTINPSNAKKFIDELKNKPFVELNAPKAKLIDVPTNDLMRFQQGVFLLLDDFTLVGKGYLTKNIRDDFAVKKWIINKDICKSLLSLQMTEKPYYNYETITDLTAVVESMK